MISPIIVALDFKTQEEALALARQLDPSLCRVKVATTLFTRYGPEIVIQLQKLGFDVFLDLKFHDIPQQVAGACAQAAKLGVWMITIHTSGGEAMMVAARDAVEQAATAGRKPILVGVTVLTSLSGSDLKQIGYSDTVDKSVTRLAQLALNCGLDGVVSSASEVATLRQCLPSDAVLVTPGIRLSGDNSDDQKRVVTPDKAMASGSSYLVIGRSITQAKEPASTLKKISDLLSG